MAEHGWMGPIEWAATWRPLPGQLGPVADHARDVPGDEPDRQTDTGEHEQGEAGEDDRASPAEQQGDSCDCPEHCCRVGEVGVGHTATGGQD